MRLLVVTQYFWPENFRINDIVLGLRQRGHQMTVLTGHPNYPSGTFAEGYDGRSIREEDYEGIRVLRMPILPRGQKSGLRLALNYLSFAVSGSLFGPGRVKEQYDAILVYGLSPMTAAFPALVMKAKIRRPLVFYLLDLWPESLSATGFVTNPVLLGLVAQMVRFIYRACDRVLVTSRSFIPRVRKLGVAAERILYVPQYAEPEYRPQAADPVWARTRHLPEGFKIMFAGNIGTAQDLFTVLDAAEITLAQEIQWVFLGGGSVLADLEAQVARRHLTNVHFLGTYPSNEMPQFFAQADALLVSLTADELFALTVPAKVQSYLACGRPVLASLDGEGAAIIRESGAGLVVPPQNAAALAAAALELQGMETQFREALGQKGRDYCEKHFDREKKLAELEDILTNVVKTVDSRNKVARSLGIRRKHYLFVRAIVEKFLALFLLIATLPVWLLIAVLIRLDSPGAVFFMQERAGRFHAPFLIYKFRTMHTGTPNVSTEDMQRSGLSPITRLGALLRRTSLDELPQILNVLRGEMSFVGPRPALTTQTRVLKLRKAAGVDQLPPGVTGYAQVTGRDDLDDEEKVRRDTEYLRRLGFDMDLHILKMTLSSVLKGTGNK